MARNIIHRQGKAAGDSKVAALDIRVSPCDGEQHISGIGRQGHLLRHGSGVDGLIEVQQLGRQLPLQCRVRAAGLPGA